MSINSLVVAGTPQYVLMDGNCRIGPKSVQLGVGIECVLIYGFSGKGPYDTFCTNSERELKPYPLGKGYLRKQVGAPGDGLKLVVLDAPGSGESSLRAATMEAVLKAQENNTTHVTAEYQLLFDWDADAYRIGAASDVGDGGVDEKTSNALTTGFAVPTSPSSEIRSCLLRSSKVHCVPPNSETQERGACCAPGSTLEDLGEDGLRVSQVVLEGPRGVLLTSTDRWGELLAIAHQYGWQPDYPEGHYHADIDLQVAPHDAYGIACALRDAVELLIRHETTATLPELPELVRDICEAIAFCCDGGFRIRCPMSEALD